MGVLRRLGSGTVVGCDDRGVGDDGAWGNGNGEWGRLSKGWGWGGGGGSVLFCSVVAVIEEGGGGEGVWIPGLIGI